MTASWAEVPIIGVVGNTIGTPTRRGLGELVIAKRDGDSRSCTTREMAGTSRGAARGRTEG